MIPLAITGTAGLVLWIALGLVVVSVAVLVVRQLALRRRGTGSASAIRAHSLNGRDVVAMSTAAKVGKVDDVLFDPEWRMVVAFQIKSAPFHHPQAFLREEVTAVGLDAIMVSDPSALNDVRRLPSLAAAASIDKLRGAKVVTETGESLGTVWDIDIDDDARRVVSYVLRGSVMQRLLRRQRAIRVEQLVRLGAGGIMVVAADTASVEHAD